MKPFILFFLLFSFNLKAEVSRSPAVVKEPCDLSIEYEGKTALAVQKEQCARVTECMQQASEKEMVELQKLQAVACKAEIKAVEAARAPAIEHDNSFDGKRKAKAMDKEDTFEKAPLKNIEK